MNHHLSSDHTDKTLIIAAQNGDMQARLLLLERYAPLLGKWSTRPIFYGQQGDARAELTHTLLRAIDDYDPTRGVPPAGYFAACVRYAAQNAGKRLLRRRTREVVTDVPIEPHHRTQETPESICLRRDLTRRLRRALPTLTPRQYAVLNAIYYGGLTRTETATLLGCSPQAVSETHHRALARLRTALTDD